MHSSKWPRSQGESALKSISFGHILGSIMHGLPGLLPWTDIPATGTSFGKGTNYCSHRSKGKKSVLLEFSAITGLDYRKYQFIITLNMVRKSDNDTIYYSTIYYNALQI